MDIEINHLKEIFSKQDNFSPSDWKGAVLFLFDKKSIYLVKRSESMPTHSGQLAFLGGHRKIDENSPQEVALREFEEETSLNRKMISIQGHLPSVMTARMHSIVPVLGLMTGSRDEFISTISSNGEWDKLIIYDWVQLLDEKKWNYGLRFGLSTHPVLLHSIYQNSYISNASNNMSHILWGATAQMIWDFLSMYQLGSQKKNTPLSNL
jgi:8-oxo-dGTP pyrophosphatase MutT (NUDIX family)